MGSSIRLRHVVVAIAALCGTATTTFAQEQNGPRAIYTEAQAARGDTVFRTVCASCHSTSEFNNAQFKATWAGKSVFTFFDQLRSTMPQDNPGGLSRQQYADVIAYITKLHGHPAGETEIPTEDEKLKSVTFPGGSGAAQQRRR